MSPDLYVRKKKKNIPTCKINIFITDSYVSKFTPKIIIGWTTVSAVISVIDFAGMVAFGVDYNNVQVTQPEQPRRYNDYATGCTKPENRGSITTEVEIFLFATVLRTDVETKAASNQKGTGLHSPGGGLRHSYHAGKPLRPQESVPKNETSSEMNAKRYSSGSLALLLPTDLSRERNF